MKKHPEVIISGIHHFTLTEAIKTLVNEKVEKLFRHEEKILRVRIELCNEHKRGQEAYQAKGHVEINGPDLHAEETTEDLYKSIDNLVNKLDRMLQQRANHNLEKRKHPHELDIPTGIPKAR